MTVQKRRDYLAASILISAVAIAGAWVYTARLKIPTPAPAQLQQTNQSLDDSSNQNVLREKVLPAEGVVLPVTWGDLGKKLVDAGVIDAEKWQALYESRESFSNEYRTLLLGNSSDRLKITQENAAYLLNLFWALGLANKNPILDSGEMTSEKYGGAGNFASTGGWTIAKDDAMTHYSRHVFMELTPEQQELVDKTSRAVYRPCCNNSTHFPDCNHGMAMLGFLELMASQGVNEKDIYKAVLAVNSYWFPDNYLTIATHMKNKGVKWENVSPQDVLGIGYSSSLGYARIAAQVVQPQQRRGGNGCGV